MWHDVDRGYYDDSFSRDNVTYLPDEGWLKTEMSLSSSPVSPDLSESLLYSTDSYSRVQFNSPPASPTKTQTLNSDFGLEYKKGSNRLQVDSGMVPYPSIIGIDKSFAIDPEFSFLHGLCIPQLPSSVESTPDEFVEPSQSLLIFSSDQLSRDSSPLPCSDPTSSSNERTVSCSSSSSSASKNHVVDSFSVLPEIGSDIKKNKRSSSKRSQLDKLDADLQERCARKLENLPQVQPETNIFENLPSAGRQWNDGTSALPPISLPQKPLLRNCPTSEGSLRPRLSVELPTIWEDSACNLDQVYYCMLFIRGCCSLLFQLVLCFLIASLLNL